MSNDQNQGKLPSLFGRLIWCDYREKLWLRLWRAFLRNEKAFPSPPRRQWPNPRISIDSVDLETALQVLLSTSYHLPTRHRDDWRCCKPGLPGTNRGRLLKPWFRGDRVPNELFSILSLTQNRSLSAQIIPWLLTEPFWLNGWGNRSTGDRRTQDCDTKFGCNRCTHPKLAYSSAYHLGDRWVRWHYSSSREKSDNEITTGSVRLWNPDDGPGITTARKNKRRQVHFWWCHPETSIPIAKS